MSRMSAFRNAAYYVLPIKDPQTGETKNVVVGVNGTPMEVVLF